MGMNSWASIMYGSEIYDDEITLGTKHTPDRFIEEVEELGLECNVAGDWDPGILIIGKDFTPSGASYVLSFDLQTLIDFPVEEKKKIDDAIEHLRTKYNINLTKPAWLLTSRYS